MDKEIERFAIVWNVKADKSAGEFGNIADAHKFARDEAAKDIGNTFIVFEPKEAFRASASVSPVYLSWPAVQAETAPPQAPMT